MAVLTFVIIADKTFLSLSAVGLIFIHELGHIISARILKMPICEINFGAMSIDIRKPLTYYQKTFTQKMIIILSGSALNFFISMILFVMYLIEKNEFILLVSFESLVIGLINILPIESLDGGDAVKLILNRFFSYELAKKISKILSFVFLIPVIFCGVLLAIKSQNNISVILLALYLIFERYF